MEDSQPKVFSVRIVSIDYYTAPPIPGLDISYSSFHGGRVNEVPVIRIYGSTPAGQKTCLHVHQVLPYLYIPCSDLGDLTNDGVDSCTHSLFLTLEKALQLKGNASSKRQHVHGCDIVRAKKFYGYHSSEELFVKIYFYYPQDVSRAANLLQTGAILDKILQPYESHIPFLLQFLIDNNLYGMGHLHVSKVKFRYPVPDVFQQKAEHNGKLRLMKHGSTCMDYQADLGGDLCLSTPIWISSTIPGGWIWQYSSQSDSSTNEKNPLFRRQSTSELEGDAAIHDIINQQFISFTPLSQTHSDVKMVQSLIPIWEEEYERNGVPEPIPSNSQKPFPQDALKILSHGIGFEKFMEVQNIMESWSLVTPESIKSLTDSGDLADSCGVNLEHNLMPSKYLKATDRKGSLLSLNSPFQNADAADIKKADADNQQQISGTMEPLSAKGMDEDVLRLLNWLASSQAAEDINSDDELARETILSPFLPSKEIGKVLERANVDYESESQRECQDILDSIDMLNFEESNGRALKPAEYNHSGKFLSNKRIPQLDGSSDDLLSSPSSGKSLKADTGEAKSHEPDFIYKHRRKRPRWGSLPISSQKVSDVSHPDTLCILNGCDETKKQSLGTWLGNKVEKLVKVDEEDVSYTERDIVTVECSMRDLMRRKRSYQIDHSQYGSPVECWTKESCSDAECGKRQINFESKLLNDIEDKKDSISPIHKPPVKNEETKCHDMSINSTVEVCDEVSHVKPTNSYPIFNNLQLCSNNDVIEVGNLQENGNTKFIVRVGCADNCCIQYVDSCQHHNMGFHVGSCKPEHARVSKTQIIGSDCGYGVLQTGPMGSHTVPPNSAPSNLASKIGCTCESGCQTSTSTGKLPDIPIEDLKGAESETIVNCENLVCYGRFPGLSMPYNSSKNEKGEAYSTSKNEHQEAETVKLIALTLSKKPPTMEWTDEPGNETPVLPKDEDSNVATSLQRSFVDDCLPFFMRDHLVDELQGVSPRKCTYIDTHEPVIGVPTIYQNDGSFLFMLTPAVSPPSRESVDGWLSFDFSDASSLKIDTSSPFLPISKGLSDDMMDLQGSQSEDISCPLPESTSLTEENPNFDRHLKHNQEKCSMEVRALNETKGKISTGWSQDFSQISGPDKMIRPTPLSQIGFRDPASVGQGQQLTLLSIEVQAESRGDLRPDPRFDAVNVIVLVFQEDDESKLDAHVLLHCGFAYVGKNINAVSESKVFAFTEELHLFDHLIKVIRASDPDVLMGWDVQSGSLGFLAERAAHLGIGLLNSISRTPSQVNVVSRDSRATEKEFVKEIFSESVTAEAVLLENTIIEDEWGRTHASGVHVGGRILLNIWRLMRNEVKLNIYTVEAVAETVLRRKIPCIPWRVLTKWFSSGPGQARYRSLNYTLERAKLNLQIMNQLDIINRTSELARVFGIDFFSVLSRGSQYRVESMFLRLAHTQNYLAISPGNQQVANQPAMECLPLVMEPESNFYADPVIVLDFQSLYPSMVIAYNLCFCTCLGKITPPSADTLGVSSYLQDINILRSLKHELLFTPNGVVYVPPKVRKGILPRLLEEILSTRIMVKQAMKKLDPSQLVHHRILNARQLALKLIANVTYGYTAAGFSGRMPCAELADSIVQCGRRTLETAISFVNSNDKWNARVIYGDTDSMFVLLKGRSLKEAFTVGREIASTITEMNPSPVTLKMEKVYYPCFLLTKKRYVGYSYESPDQSKPIFDAKGIETVRRDTCGAVSKTMEQSLRIYFESQDIDKVKAYMLRQWTRILSGRVSLQDFIFAKEVRLGTYSARVCSLPPAAIVATKSVRVDPRAEPRYAERIPYVVVHGEPGARLVDMVLDPLELLALSSPFRLNDIYYIRKQIIPALQRVFGLVGANLNQWFLDMPRPVREAAGKCNSLVPNPLRMRIDYYYASKHCILCGELVQGSTHLCPSCSMDETTVATALTGKTSKLEKESQHLAAICRHCGGGDWLIESGVKCTSLACSVFYERMKVQKELQSLSQVATSTGFYPKCMVEWF